MEGVKFCVPSSDNVHTLCGVVYIPNGEIKGVYQIVHGMTEHIARYDRFMRDMADMGYLCFGHDHLGHGHTAGSDSELGYIANKNGYDYLVRDVKVFYEAVVKEYGCEDKPYFLMGHSMGSFVARLAASRAVCPHKLIVMGTGGANPAADIALALIAVIKRFKGEKHYSKLLDTLAFGSYNKRFGGGTKEDPKPWLTNDVDARKLYYADKFCTFNFSVSAMGDLIRLMKYSNQKSFYKVFVRACRCFWCRARRIPSAITVPA
jgi:alpha-beta hydrolase superfamily lysophospholipase